MLAVVTPAAATPHTVGAAANVGRATALEGQLVKRINQARRARGLRPLLVASGLVRAARGHARAMARRGFFSHSSPDGTSPSRRISRTYAGSPVGETLLWATTPLTAREALARWLASGSHRRVLLFRSFRHIGLAAVRAKAAPGIYGGRDVTIVVADFGGA